MVSRTSANEDALGRDVLVAAAAVFAVALALRFGHLAGLRSGLADTHLFSSCRGDATLHWRDALAVSAGRWLPWDTVPWKGPGYTYFLAGLMQAFGPSPGTLRWPLALLGSLNCAALVLLARRVLPTSWSCVAGLLAAGNGVLIFYDGELFFPTLLITLSLGTLWLVGRPDPGKATIAAAGLWMGCAALVHPVYLVPAAALSIRQGMRRPAHAALLAVGVAVAIAPIALSNRIVGGQPVLISWNGGINLYAANHPNFDQVSGNRTRAWARILQSTLDAGIERESDRDRFYYSLAARQAIRDPGKTLSILLRKAALLGSPVEYANNVRIYELRPYSPVLAATLGRWGPLWLPFGILGPLSVLGLALALRRRSTPDVTLAFWAAGLAATIVLSFVTARYRVPLVFFGSIWASGALAAMIEAWRDQRRRRFAALFGVLLGLVVVAGLLAEPQRGYPLPLEWDEASVLATHGAFERAEPWALRAVDRAPTDPELLHAVAGFYARQGRRIEERRFLDRLLALPDLEPDMTTIGEMLLARSYASDGKFDEARAAIRAARAVRPDAAQWHGYPHFQLGLGPVTDCWLRLEAAGIEIEADSADSADEARRIMAGVRDDCKETGRLAIKLAELDVALVLRRP